ncbi:MAG: Gfo/Idh/MocA family protein [Rhodothermales bacterium]
MMNKGNRLPAPYRVGVMGLGHWYAAYGLGRGLVEYPKADLVACASPDQAKASEFAGTFGISAYASYAEMLDDAELDIVLIAAPVSEIPACAEMAARAGKHIILGKPMAMTLAEADQMVSVVEAAGVLCIPFQVIARLGAMGLKQRIQKNEIGDIAVMHQTSRWSIAEDWYQSGKPGWFVDPKHVPGGALIDEGIYAIELFSWLAESKIVAVEARIANLVHKDIEVEDWGMASFTLENGVIATLEAGWTINAPRKTGPSPKQNAVVRLEIIGTRGEIMKQNFRDPGLAVLAAGADNWVFERQAGNFFGPADPNPLAYLIECLEEGKQPISTIADAHHSFSAALAAYESVRLGKSVRLADLAR